MIIPVYVSHGNDTQNEVLVYALLDTQSDTSFISDATYRKLGVAGIDTVLKLSTMTDDGGTLQSQRLDGLFVRGFNSDLKIALPTVYTHECIPACRDTIPTPEMAWSWPHLSRIANELMPKSEIDIGLLIGYNCPRALAPRDVIPPEGEGPFAQKTSLGWGIVGTAYNSGGIESHCTHLCTESSHLRIVLRTSVKEVLIPENLTYPSESRANPFEKGLSIEDERFLSLMEAEARKTEDHHYEMPLPFRDPGKKIIDNKCMALQRLNSLEKSSEW